MPKWGSYTVDTIEAGAGPVVVLVHSSVAGARQWRRLIDELSDRYRVIAVNLFGYGATPAWRGPHAQSLDDQASLVVAALPDGANTVMVVGHSFGGAVAMKAAARLNGRVTKLALFEPNPFYLLSPVENTRALSECLELRDAIMAGAARKFADYWGGTGTWASMDAKRRASFSKGFAPVRHEADAIFGEETSLYEWSERLPTDTLVVLDRNTVLPIRAIAALFRDACPHWRFVEIEEGGHMAPLTHPEIVNPILARFLDGSH